MCGSVGPLGWMNSANISNVHVHGSWLPDGEQNKEWAPPPSPASCFLISISVHLSSCRLSNRSICASLRPPLMLPRRLSLLPSIPPSLPSHYLLLCSFLASIHLQQRPLVEIGPFFCPLCPSLLLRSSFAAHPHSPFHTSNHFTRSLEKKGNGNKLVFNCERPQT